MNPDRHRENPVGLRCVPHHPGLSDLALHGLGEPRDPAAALERYRRGGEAGSSKAQYRLGLLYLEGRLVPADPVQARYWLAVAAANGDEEAARRLSALPGPMPAGQ